LVYLKLRSPFMVWVLAKLLLKRKLEGRRDIFISFNDIRAMLGYSKKSKTMPSYIIKEAISWGVLSKAWKGYYKINWEAVNHVALATIPKNIGTKALHNEYLTKGWQEVKEAKEVIGEFNALLGGTRVYGSQLWLLGGLEPPAGVASNTSNTPPTKRSKRTVTAKPAKPPHFNHLTPTMIVVGHSKLPVLKLGNVYLLMLGVRGGAQTTFPCIRCTTPAGGTRYLCAGSESVLLELLSYTGPNPTCSVYGGDLSPTSLVADIPGQGLTLFDTAPADTPRLEPGVQVYNTALLAFATRYNLYVGYSSALGVPSLEVVPRSVVYSELKRGNLRLLAGLPLILDALIGTVHSALSQLPSIDSLSLRQLPRALPSDTPPPAGAGTVTVYVDYKLEVEGRKQRRNLAALSDFLALLRYYADRGKKVSIYYLKLIIPLAGAEATGLADTLNFGFLYIYRNQHKDPPNAIRIELRPYAGVKHALGKYGLLDLLVRSLRELLPALEATHRALVPWTPLNDQSRNLRSNALSVSATPRL